MMFMIWLQLTLRIWSLSSPSRPYIPLRSPRNPYWHQGQETLSAIQRELILFIPKYFLKPYKCVSQCQWVYVQEHSTHYFDNYRKWSFHGVFFFNLRYLHIFCRVVQVILSPSKVPPPQKNFFYNKYSFATN